MIAIKPVKFKTLDGSYQGEVIAVTSEENSYYDPKNENSTSEVLEISFQLEDPETGDAIMHSQKFVSPLFGGNGLFQQLLDVSGYLPDQEGEPDFDEQSFVGLKVIATMGPNKKGYTSVLGVVADTSAKEEKKAPAKASAKKSSALPY